MFSGSYSPDDVEILMNPMDVSNTPIEEKERLIQSGRRHYSEMITRERPPSEAYLRVFHEAFERGKVRLARDIVRLAGLTAERRPDGIALVSLARAGTPIGVLLARTLRRHLGRSAPHYSISIIRDRGIDRVALKYVLDRHDPAEIVFVDGWTGKGVIAAELARSVSERGEALDAGLFVVADLSGTAGVAASADDWLIPTCILGATVSGLVSRSILNDEVVRSGGFHGCLHYREFADADLSRWFVDRMSEEIARQASDVLRGPLGGTTDDDRTRLRRRSADFLREIHGRYGIRDANHIKPGIGEATRVLLRRVPDRLLLREPDDPGTAHLRVLAREKGVPTETDPSLPYSAAAIIKEVDG